MLSWWRGPLYQGKENRMTVAQITTTELARMKPDAFSLDLAEYELAQLEKTARRKANRLKFLERKARKFLRKQKKHKKRISPYDRKSPEYKRFRLAVLRRDGFQCVRCHAKEDLHVHHCMVTYADSRKRRIDVSNGVTVCLKCHELEHPWMRKYYKDGKRRIKPCTQNAPSR